MLPLCKKNNPLVIAVDGPAASGKGTLAKRIAEKLGALYLDTGGLYRALAYQVIKEDQSLQDSEAIVKIAQQLTLQDIKNAKLYDEKIGNAASMIAANQLVRKALIECQREVARSPQGAVLDGRDIGTVICPDADFKFYITAQLETRAYRRYKQLQNTDGSIIYRAVLEDLRKRDQRDEARSVAPLKKAQDAIHIDTTNMSSQQVMDKAMSVINSGKIHTSRNKPFF